MTTTVYLNGRVHGQTIEFDEPLPCDDGQRVRVMLIPDQPATTSEALPPGEDLPHGEGLRRAFGILTPEEGEDLDRFLESSRKDSLVDRASEQT